jgi:hypothetical protein
MMPIPLDAGSVEKKNPSLPIASSVACSTAQIALKTRQGRSL